jgi:branched-chain amino acid transport system permease protein
VGRFRITPGLSIGIATALLLALPLVANAYVVILATTLYIQIIGVLGLNLLTGNAGLISLGYSAFLAIGAYANTILQVDLGVPALLAIPAGGLVAAALGLIVGVPSLRLRGLYLAITTLALAIIVNVVIVEGGSLTRGSEGIAVPPLAFFGISLGDTVSLNVVCLLVCAVFTLLVCNIERSDIGRAFMAIRESEVAAAASGIDVTRTKLIAFMLSSFAIGVAGGLFSHFVGYLNVDSFDPTIGIEALAMIIAGGLGSPLGSIFGVLFLTLLSELLNTLATTFASTLAAVLPTQTAALDLRSLVFGLTIILFLRYQPHGVVGLSRACTRLLRPRAPASAPSAHPTTT